MLVSGRVDAYMNLHVPLLLRGETSQVICLYRVEKYNSERWLAESSGYFMIFLLGNHHFHVLGVDDQEFRRWFS